jgi:hypothetical protein
LASQSCQKRRFCRLLTIILQLQRILAEHAARHRDRDALLRTDKTAKCRWLKPHLFASKYADWTDVNHLRLSKFIALRDGRLAKDVGRS